MINPYMNVIYNSIMWMMPSAFAMSMLLALQPLISELYDITSIYFMARKPDPVYIDLTQSPEPSPEPSNPPGGGSAPEPVNPTEGESSSAVEDEETEDAGPSKPNLNKGKAKAEGDTS